MLRIVYFDEPTLHEVATRLAQRLHALADASLAPGDDDRLAALFDDIVQDVAKSHSAWRRRRPIGGRGRGGPHRAA